jgi:hypothetical protein
MKHAMGGAMSLPRQTTTERVNMRCLGSMEVGRAVAGDADKGRFVAKIMVRLMVGPWLFMVSLW